MTAPSGIFSVTDLTRSIKGLLEADFKNISVQGELSNYKLHSSGHLYFTIKDESSQIQGVMWRSRAARLFFTPQDGMKIIATGNITVYEVRGVYQIDVVTMQPLGAGELQMAFERLKRRLSEEGLFDAAHKKPLPRYPGRIGIVTSPTGAALHDILNILNRRYPGVEIVLAPVKVQGSGAAEEIAGAIRDLNEYSEQYSGESSTIGRIDVLIIGRGGGSIEDLWTFNEEVVARAIYASAIPVVSAVGHEIDFTIADFVADLRAPTPSAAAELTVPDSAELVEIVRNFDYTCRNHLRDRIATERANIASIVESYSFNRPVDLLRQLGQRLDELQRMLGSFARQQLSTLNERTQSLRKRLESVDPLTVLERGYAVIYRYDKVVMRAGQLESHDQVKIKFHDGTRPAVVD